MAHSIGIIGVAFGRNIVGIITRPYETYRRIVEHGILWELGYIGMLLGVYFFAASRIKYQFVVFPAAALTYVFAVTLFWLAGRLVGSKGTWKKIALGWGYSLIPTLSWFWMTSLLYVIIPPPRTTSAWGIAFSILYLLLSSVFLCWKVILSYLTLRFALKLDLGKILIVSAMTLPIIALYSIGMYRWGIFRIPFI